MIGEPDIFSARMLSAVLNGVYQGVVLSWLIWLALKIFPGTNAATRYLIHYVTLLVAAALPFSHFLWSDAARVRIAQIPAGLFRGTSEGSPTADALVERLPVAGVSAKNSVLSAAHHDKAVVHMKEGPMNFAATAFPQLDLIELADGESSRYGVPTSAGARKPPGGGRPGPGVPVAVRPGRNCLLSASLPWWGGPIAIGLWVLLSSLRLLSLCRQYRVLHQLKRKARPAAPPLSTWFGTLCRSEGGGPAPPLLTSAELTTPVVAGFARPAVLLPAALMDHPDPKGLEGILRHELAHVRRRDGWSNLLQQIIGAVWFFHPAVAWLSRCLTIDREIACDDHVIAAIGAPKAYALFLTEFARRTHNRHWIAATAAWTSKSQLNERISMILDTKRNSSVRLARARTGVLTGAVITVALIGLQIGPRVAFAQAGGADASTTHQRPEKDTSPPNSTLEPSGRGAQQSVIARAGEPSDRKPRPGPRERARKTRRHSLPPGDAVAADDAHRDRSIEARLDRLERMIEALVDQKTAAREPRPPGRGKEWKFEPEFNRDDLPGGFEGRFGSEEHRQRDPLSPEQIERIRREAHQTATEALEQAAKALGDTSGRARKFERYERRSRLKQQRRSPFRDDISDFSVLRRNLERQKGILRRHLEAIKEQLDDLDRQLDRIHPQLDGVGGASEGIEEGIEDEHDNDHVHGDGEDLDRGRGIDDQPEQGH